MHDAYVSFLLRAKWHATDNNTLKDITIKLNHNKTLALLGFTNHEVASCELV
jgi:hypothetical protein